MSTRLSERPRAAVIGAGLAGLTAASRLAERDIDVVVLEARERVGGRTHGIEVAPGAWVDAGAAYIGERHTQVSAALADLDLTVASTTMAGASRFALGAGNRTQPGRFPPLNAVALGGLFDLLDDLTKMVRVDAPWLTPNADELDKMTAAEWAVHNLPHPDARLFFPLFLGEMMAAVPADVSVLHMGFYLASGGGLRYLNAFEGGAQQSRIVGGAHGICERLALHLGDRVRLGEAVQALRQDSAGVTVCTTTGEHHVDRVVSAIPPLLADAIHHEPGLPLGRSGALTAPGCAVKVHLVWPRPLWRDAGLSGWSVSSEGPLLSTVDDSPPGSDVGVLTGFVTGSEAQRYGALAPAEQRAAALVQASRLFPELPAPIGFYLTDWVRADYSRGCYAALFGPGDWVRQGPHLTTPHGRVHWAGTETCTEYFGLMEGAVRSGQRVAAEILNQFNASGRSQ